MRILSPLTGEPTNHPIATVDIETWGLDANESGDSFALGVWWDGHTSKSFTDISEFRAFLASGATRGYYVFAHNGGRYDYIALFGNYLRQNPNALIMSKNKFIALKVRENRHVRTFGDFMNLIPSSLDSIGKALGVPKGKTPQKFIDGDRSQGITQDDIEYCLQDCKVLWTAATALFDELGETALTAPGLALKYWRRNYQPRKYYTDDNNLLSREAYYGGRVEAYYIGKVPTPGGAYYYDINSLYPQAMLSGAYPRSDPFLREGEHLRIPSYYVGTAYAKVSVPHSLYLPILPYRVPETRKLLFPVGKFSGWWTLAELRKAEELGATVDISKALVSRPIENPFIHYVEDIYDKKSKAIGFKREVYKLLLNSLYGKFGELRGEEKEYAEEFSLDHYRELGEKHPDVTWVPFSAGREDGYYVWGAPEGGVTDHSIYSWASHITAYSRLINLDYHQRILAAGGKVFYTDTDSFFVDRTLESLGLSSMLGEELGALKLEKKRITIIRGAKAYTDAKGVTTLKGVPRKAEGSQWGYATYSRVIGPREALRTGTQAGKFAEISKRTWVTYSKRVVQRNGWTTPHIIGN